MHVYVRRHKNWRLDNFPIVNTPTHGCNVSLEYVPIKCNVFQYPYLWCLQRRVLPAHSKIYCSFYMFVCAKTKMDKIILCKFEYISIEIILYNIFVLIEMQMCRMLDRPSLWRIVYLVNVLTFICIKIILSQLSHASALRNVKYFLMHSPIQFPIHWTI